MDLAHRVCFGASTLLSSPCCRTTVAGGLVFRISLWCSALSVGCCTWILISLAENQGFSHGGGMFLARFWMLLWILVKFAKAFLPELK